MLISKVSSKQIALRGGEGRGGGRAGVWAKHSQPGRERGNKKRSCDEMKEEKKEERYH